MDGLRDYVAWHEQYDDPTSALSARLRAVQADLTTYLDATAPEPVRVLSVCAGDGRDLLGSLAGRADRARVRGGLLEIEASLVDRARTSVAPDLGPDICRWFAQAGFELVSLAEEVEGTQMRVGVHRYVGDAVPVPADELLFTFLR